jgi:5'-methylthioadenosine phosphorylase
LRKLENRLKKLAKAEVAIIGGTGFEKPFKDSKPLRIKTPYGTVPLLLISEVAGKKVVFLPRHGPRHALPPHKIHYKANVYALHKIGVERILATNAVGAINADFRPGDIVVPHDFVDFTKLRAATFFDKAPVTHIDVSQPYCPELRQLVVKRSRRLGLHVWDKGVLACTEGPRYETVAEIEALRRVGCDVVGMTGFPEVVLAIELGVCYASICYVSNMAAGMQKRLTVTELTQVSKQILPKLEQVLTETVEVLVIKRSGKCSCDRALEDARFK